MKADELYVILNEVANGRMFAIHAYDKILKGLNIDKERVSCPSCKNEMDIYSVSYVCEKCHTILK